MKCSKCKKVKLVGRYPKTEKCAKCTQSEIPSMKKYKKNPNWTGQIDSNRLKKELDVNNSYQMADFKNMLDPDSSLLMSHEIRTYEETMKAYNIEDKTEKSRALEWMQESKALSAYKKNPMWHQPYAANHGSKGMKALHKDVKENKYNSLGAVSLPSLVLSTMAEELES